MTSFFYRRACFDLRLQTFQYEDVKSKQNVLVCLLHILKKNYTAILKHLFNVLIPICEAKQNRIRCCLLIAVFSHDINKTPTQLLSAVGCF